MVWKILRGVGLSVVLSGVGLGGTASAAEFYVSPAGSDAGLGDSGAPFKTIGKAAGVAKPGDTLWVHGGVYRESIHVGTPGHEPMTIEAVAGEKPQIFGSDALTGWKEARHDMFSVNLPAGRGARGWLFIDDQPATRSTSSQPTKPNEFALAHAETNPIGDNQIFVQLKPGDRPDAHRFEWADRSSVVVFDSGACPVHLKGLDLAFAAGDKQEAMVFLSPGSVMENCVVRDSLTRGVSVSEKGTVEHCDVFDHGILGIGSAGDSPDGVHGLLILDNEIHNNAWNNADTGWEAGGVKLSLQRDSIVRGNNIHDNLAWGIWFDWLCTGNRIEHNICRHNVAAGIFLEASSGRNFIVNNICNDNRKDPRNDWGDGIFSHDSSDALVAHNLCSGNDCFGIRFRLDSDRKLPGGGTVECSRNVIANNICAGNLVGQVQLPPAAPLQLDNVSDGNILFSDLPGAHTAETLEYKPVIDFAAWRQLGFDQHSTDAKPAFRDAASQDFHPAEKGLQVGLSATLAEVPTDFDGHARCYPKTSAGPFEGGP